MFWKKNCQNSLADSGNKNGENILVFLYYKKNDNKLFIKKAKGPVSQSFVAVTQKTGVEQSGLFFWEMPVAVFIEVSHLDPVRNFWNKTYFAYAK